MNRFFFTDSPHKSIRGEAVELGDGSRWIVPRCQIFVPEERRFVSSLPNYVPDPQRAMIEAACARTFAGLCGGTALAPAGFLDLVDTPEAFLTFNLLDARRDAATILKLNYELCAVQLECLLREDEQRHFVADVLAAAADARGFTIWARELLSAAPARGA